MSNTKSVGVKVKMVNKREGASYGEIMYREGRLADVWWFRDDRGHKFETREEYIARAAEGRGGPSYPIAHLEVIA